MVGESSATAWTRVHPAGACRLCGGGRAGGRAALPDPGRRPAGATRATNDAITQAVREFYSQLAAVRNIRAA